MSIFSMRIRKLRSKAGISQKKLGESVGVPQQTIARWEKEITAPDPAQLASLCDALHVSADYLLGLTDDPCPRSLSEREKAALEQYAADHSQNMSDTELAAKLPPDMRDAIMAAVRLEIKKRQDRS